MRQWVVRVRDTEELQREVVQQVLRRPIIRALPVMKDIQRAATVVYRQPVTQDVQRQWAIAARREARAIP